MMKWAARTIGFLALTVPAWAMAAVGEPTKWGLGLQDAASPVMERINDFHNLLLYIITAITIFVLALLVYVIFRFNAKANPTPSKTTHNTLIEVVWTVVPVLILIGVAIPSFKLLYFADRTENPELTVKAIGHQWFWKYEVPKQTYKGEEVGGFVFSSYMLDDANLKEGDLRLLSVDHPLALPVGTRVQVLVTAADVIHNFAMPSLGLKLDAVPGRLNETWTLINPEFAGKRLFGQCSELCGDRHAYMPIEVRAMDEAAFVAWVKDGARKAEAGEDGYELPEPPARPYDGHATPSPNLTQLQQ